MASLTIRNIDDALKERLRVRAATKGHSMEEEARQILARVVGGASGPELLAASRKLFGPKHGVQLKNVSRKADRAAPDFAPDDP